MNVSDLIAELSKLPQDTKVYVFDWRKNISEDSGDGSSAGIYSEFEVSLIPLSELTEESKEPIVVVSFSNDDYNEDGTRAE